MGVLRGGLTLRATLLCGLAGERPPCGYIWQRLLQSYAAPTDHIPPQTAVDDPATHSHDPPRTWTHAHATC
eukprot:8481701-Pyramimonas_sp.AAC.1